MEKKLLILFSTKVRVQVRNRIFEIKKSRRSVPIEIRIIREIKKYCKTTKLKRNFISMFNKFSVFYLIYRVAIRQLALNKR